MIAGFSALQSIPAVVVGLTVYLVFSRSGPLGDLKLLFTHSSMIIGQILLAFPLLVALSHAVAALALLPWVIYVGWWPSLGQLAVLVGFGALQMAIPYTFMLRGLRSVSSQEAVAIALIEPVLNPLWVFLFGLETPAWWSMIGACLILIGLVLRYVVWELVAGNAANSRTAQSTPPG